ncbi:hypothetical protein [Kineococcus sp. SYSU DK005]|uniref:hypothetical protein n=1 Tax=Kineococcus sp. SYSU DK005 TaxID=3383126 RepID=UPI003D7F0C4C
MSARQEALDGAGPVDRVVGGLRAPQRSLLRAEVVRSMTVPRSRVERTRARASAAAAAGIGTALLIAAAVAGVRDTVLVGTSVWTDDRGREVSEELYQAGGGLAPFLAQPGLRTGSVTAAVLLVLPFLALAVQALRVGQVVEERRSRQLLIAGATWADLRRLRVARTSAAFVRGALLAAPVYLLLWLVLGLALPSGWRLLPPLQWEMPLVWFAVLGALWVFARVLAVLGWRRDRALALQRAGMSAEVPSRLFVLLTAAGGVAVLFSSFAAGSSEALFAAALVVSLVLFLLAAGAGSARSAAGTVRGPVPTRPGSVPEDASAGGSAGAVRARRGGSPDQRRSSRWTRRRAGGRDSAVGLLADAQRRGSTAAVRGTAGVLFVCGLSFGVESSLSAQLLAEHAAQGDGSGRTGSELAFYLGGAGLAAAVGVVAAVVALAALVLSLTDHLLGNRRAVASTAALGAETRQLVRVQALCLARTAVPVTALGVLAAAVPYSLLLVAGGTSDDRGGAPWAALLPLVVAAVAAALVALVCRVLAGALGGRVRAAAALENLRVP